MKQTLAALAAAAGTAGLATAIALAPQLSGQAADRLSHAAGGDPTSTPQTREPRPHASLAVAAPDVPAVIAGMVPEGELGQVLQDARFPLEDGSRSKVVHFLFDGAITTFVVEPAGSLASCPELATADTSQVLRCEVVDGLETLTWSDADGPDIPAHGVSVWQHRFVVSLVSYSNPRIGLQQPPISIEELLGIARSQVWFDRD